MLEKRHLAILYLMFVFQRNNGCSLTLIMIHTRLTLTMSKKWIKKFTFSVNVNARLKVPYLQGCVQKAVVPTTGHTGPGRDRKTLESDNVKKSRFWGMFRYRRSTITVCPATPVFCNPVLERPDMGCIFPDMRLEDTRFASFRYGHNNLVNQFATTLAVRGYYYDEIHRDIRCFCCGAVFNGHFPRCRQTREQSNVPFNQCWSYRQESLQSVTGLLTIIRSPGFTLPDPDPPRGQARARQHWQSHSLPQVFCLSCGNSPHHDVVYSCRHRARTCERCCPEQDLCPYCHRGTLNNPLMTEYRRRTSFQTSRNSRTCLLCGVRNPNILLFPCLHLVTCSLCNRVIHCLRCGTRIQGFVETLE